MREKNPSPKEANCEGPFFPWPSAKKEREEHQDVVSAGIVLFSHTQGSGMYPFTPKQGKRESRRNWEAASFI